MTSRTKMETRVSNVPPDVVRSAIFKWLERNGFAILTLESSEEPIDFGSFGNKVKLHPKAGRIVCLHYKWTSMVAFEFAILADTTDVLVNGEFYVPAAVPMMEDEYDLDPEAAFMARVPRRRGYKLMKDLEGELLSVSK